MKIQEKRKRLLRRKKRVRAKVIGTAQVPRLSVYRSLAHIYAQVIDDQKGVTLVSATDSEFKGKRKGKAKRANRVDLAFEVGKLVAERALKKGVTKIVFDRGGRAYHGQVKRLAEGAREGGLHF